MVLSDPSYNRGHGERAFINDIGAAWDMGPEDLDRGFFDADMVVFGGTALVPGLHDSLSTLLRKAKELDRITVVNTVYDFRNEMARPGERWPMGDSDAAYALTDLLICDLEEARRLSGEEDLQEAGAFFIDQGVSAFLITCGTDPGLAWSGGNLFERKEMKAFPISSALVRDLKGYRGGDTTGCGDNFAGGVLASLARQLMKGNKPADLDECIAWGTVSGGFCCFYTGGSYPESGEGEKAARILPYYVQYKTQVHD
jgi:sugar/nucleoside kinase (ribokinase family)